MSEDVKIWVFAETEEAIAFSGVDGERVSEDTGGSFSPSPSSVTESVKGLWKKKRVPLDAQALKTQMNGLMQVVGDLFRESEHQTGMHLDEVSLTVEINAEGQIGIVGNGGKLGNSGGITMKFSRPAQSKPTASPSLPIPSKAKPSIQLEKRAPSPASSPRIPSFSLPLSRRRMLQIMGFTGGSAGVWWLGRMLVLEPDQDWSFDASSLPLQEISEDGSTLGFNIATVDVASKSIEVKRKTAALRSENLGDDIFLDLVKIPAGTFLMGSPVTELDRFDREGPQHEVTLESFWMSRFPITQLQWKAIASWSPVDRELEADPSTFTGDNRPVERVSWNDAVEACKRLSAHLASTEEHYRLPSESEWEYACRAGTPTPFHFGETITTELANYRGIDKEAYGWSASYGSGPKGTYRETTTSVDTFAHANAFGLSDMHGNVWEWCQDTWHDSYEGTPPTDGSAWQETPPQRNYRVLRGGSWDDIPRNCRSAYRRIHSPGTRSYHLGFRVVVSAPGLSSP